MRSIEFEILLTLAAEERHGYAIIQDIERRSGGSLSVETGTLYRALQRLVESDLVRPTDAPRAALNDDERRRFYAITPAGRRAAAAEAKRHAWPPVVVEPNAAAAGHGGLSGPACRGVSADVGRDAHCGNHTDAANSFSAAR